MYFCIFVFLYFCIFVYIHFCTFGENVSQHLASAPQSSSSLLYTARGKDSPRVARIKERLAPRRRPHLHSSRGRLAPSRPHQQCWTRQGQSPTAAVVAAATATHFSLFWQVSQWLTLCDVGGQMGSQVPVLSVPELQATLCLFSALSSIFVQSTYFSTSRRFQTPIETCTVL